MLSIQTLWTMTGHVAMPSAAIAYREKSAHIGDPSALGTTFDNSTDLGSTSWGRL